MSASTYDVHAYYIFVYIWQYTNGEICIASAYYILLMSQLYMHEILFLGEKLISPRYWEWRPYRGDGCQYSIGSRLTDNVCRCSWNCFNWDEVEAAFSRRKRVSLPDEIFTRALPLCCHYTFKSMLAIEISGRPPPQRMCISGNVHTIGIHTRSAKWPLIIVNFAAQYLVGTHLMDKRISYHVMI